MCSPYSANGFLNSFTACNVCIIKYSGARGSLVLPSSYKSKREIWGQFYLDSKCFANHATMQHFYAYYIIRKVLCTDATALSVCGQGVQPPALFREVNLTSQSAFISFTADSSVQYSGSQMAVEAVPPPANGTVWMCPPTVNTMKSSAIVLAPGSPVVLYTNLGPEYPANVQCYVSVSLSNASFAAGWMIRLRPLSLDTECSDALTAWDGPTTQSPLALSVCGRSVLPPALYREVNASSQTVLVRFISDASVQYSGSSMLVEAVPPLPSSMFVMCPPTAGTTKSSSLVLAPGSSTLFVSNLGLEYPPNAQCLVTLSLSNAAFAAGWMIRFRPVSLDTECSDALNGYDGPATSSPLALSVCGQGTLPPPLYRDVNTTQQTVLLRFASDGSVQYSGSRILVDVTPPLPPSIVWMCPPTAYVTRSTSIVLTPGAPVVLYTNLGLEYPQSMQCLVSITLSNASFAAGWMIRLRPLSLDSESFDTLNARDGPTTSWPLALSVSGQGVQPPLLYRDINATQQTVLVRFASDGSVQYSGSRMLVEAVPPLPVDTFVMCPPTAFTSRSVNLVVTPALPVNVYTNLGPLYPPSVTCFLNVTLDAPADWTIRLRPVSVNSEGFDPLYVWDGPDSTFPLAAAYSGTSGLIPPLYSDINATRRSLFLRFSSDGSGEYAGIRVLLEAVPPLPRSMFHMCEPSGYSYKSSSMIIYPDAPVLSATNFGPEYPPGVTCLAFLYALPACLLRVRLQSIVLDYYDPIYIFDGNSTAFSPVLYSVGGQPSSFPAELNATLGGPMTLRFISDGSTQNAGARMLVDSICPYFVTATPTATTSITQSAWATPPSATITGTATASGSGSASVTASRSPSVNVAGTPSITASTSPSASSAATPSGSASPSLLPSPSKSGSGTTSVSASSSAAATVSATPSLSVSGTAGASASVMASVSVFPSASPSTSMTASRSQTPAASGSGSTTASMSALATPSVTGSASPSMTASSSLTISPSASRSPSPSLAATGSVSSSLTSTASASPSVSPSISVAATVSASASASPSTASSITRSPSASGSVSASPSASPSISASVSPSTTGSTAPSPSISRSGTATPLPTAELILPHYNISSGTSSSGSGSGGSAAAGGDVLSVSRELAPGDSLTVVVPADSGPATVLVTARADAGDRPTSTCGLRFAILQLGGDALVPADAPPAAGSSASATASPGMVPSTDTSIVVYDGPAPSGLQPKDLAFAAPGDSWTTGGDSALLVVDAPPMPSGSGSSTGAGSANSSASAGGGAGIGDPGVAVRLMIEPTLLPQPTPSAAATPTASAAASRSPSISAASGAAASVASSVSRTAISTPSGTMAPVSASASITAARTRLAMSSAAAEDPGLFPLSSTIDVSIGGVPYQRLADAIDALRPVVDAARSVLLPIASEYAAADDRVALVRIADAATEASVIVPVDSPVNARLLVEAADVDVGGLSPARRRQLQATPSSSSAAVQLRLHFSAVLAAATTRNALQARLQSPATAAVLAAAIVAALRFLEATLQLPPGSVSIVEATVSVAASAASASPSSGAVGAAAAAASKAPGSSGVSIGVIAGAAGAGALILIAVAAAVVVLARSRRKAAARARKPFLAVDRRYSVAPKLGDAGGDEGVHAVGAAAGAGTAAGGIKRNAVRAGMRGSPVQRGGPGGARQKVVSAAAAYASSQQISLAANPMYKSSRLTALGSAAVRAAADEEEQRNRESKHGEAGGRRSSKQRAPPRKSAVVRKQFVARPRSEDEDGLADPQAVLEQVLAARAAAAAASASPASSLDHAAAAWSSGASGHSDGAIRDVTNPMQRRGGGAGGAGASALSFAAASATAAPRRHQPRAVMSYY